MPMSTRVESGYDTLIKGKSHKNDLSPDGGSIGISMVDWIAPPNFYKVGQLIVLYIGTNTSLLKVLESTLGAQFAGR